MYESEPKQRAKGVLSSDLMTIAKSFPFVPFFLFFFISLLVFLIISE